MTLVKQEFVRRVLRDVGREMKDDQTRRIQKHLHFRTGRLLRDRTMKVVQASQMDGQLTATSPIYLRFLDMNTRNRQVSKNMAEFKGRGGRKGFPVYNKVMFSYLNVIAYRLMYGLTNQVADQIKKELNNQTI